MTEIEAFLTRSRSVGVLVDTNLLVLLIVGRVNPNRIAQFKRTQKYSKEDYEVLQRLLQHALRLYAVPHVLAEVNTLVDLKGTELKVARHFFKHAVDLILAEEAVTSRAAAQHAAYPYLGLNDAAVAVAAKQAGFAVLTDDLRLYAALLDERIPAVNFAHVLEHSWT